jgi:hypothetical protein
MADLSLPRETGSEKSDLECPTCGGLVPVVTSAYGSTSPGACPICWPAAAPSQLAAQLAAANAPDPVIEAPVPPGDPVDAPEPSGGAIFGRNE